jgi:NADPH2:quinone reductase
MHRRQPDHVQERARGMALAYEAAQPASAWAEAWTVITELLKSGQVKPIVARIFSLEDAAEALRYLIEGRPFGRGLLAI